MSDWDAVQKAAEANRAQRFEESYWPKRESIWEKEAEQRLEDRVDQFIQELAETLHVSREWRRSDGKWWLMVLIGRKPMTVAGPDAVAEVRLESPTHYYLRDLPMGVQKNTFTLPALIDQLVALAAEVVTNPDAGTLPPIRAESYVVHLKRKARSDKRWKIFSTAYGLVGLIVGVASFLGSWNLLEEAFGALGLWLGWIPALVVGLFAGWLWGLIVLAAAVYGLALYLG